MEEIQTSSTPSKKMNVLIPAAILGVLVVGVASAMVLRRPEPMPSDDMMMESMMPMASNAPQAQDANAVDPDMIQLADGEVQILEVEGGSFYYKPNELRIKKGQPVKIVFNSKDMMHDLVIDELNVRTPVTKGGTTSEVTFTADKAGTFEFYCSVGQHRAQGQVGKIIVEE